MKPKSRPKPVERAAARLGAVQALYQMDLGGTDIGETLAQFSVRASGENFDDGQCGEADYKFLKEVTEGVVREQTLIDTTLDGLLDPAWPLTRLDATVRAILRAGAFEIIFMERVPARATISEYMAVTDAFFDREQPAFVNGVLDKLARQRRPQEFA
jgi:N utilization substance protein B